MVSCVYEKLFDQVGLALKLQNKRNERAEKSKRLLDPRIRQIGASVSIVIRSASLWSLRRLALFAEQRRILQGWPYLFVFRLMGLLICESWSLYQADEWERQIAHKNECRQAEADMARDDRAVLEKLDRIAQQWVIREV